MNDHLIWVTVADNEGQMQFSIGRESAVFVDGESCVESEMFSELN